MPKRGERAQEKMTHLCICIRPSTIDAIWDICDESGENRSVYLRRVIQDAVTRDMNSED